MADELKTSNQKLGQPYQCIGGSMYHADPAPNDGTTLFVLAEDFETQRCEIERLQRVLAQSVGDHNHTDHIFEENDRLRAALDFYADESNWIDKHSHIPYCDADRDMGMRAREALRGADETESSDG